MTSGTALSNPIPKADVKEMDLSENAASRSNTAPTVCAYPPHKFAEPDEPEGNPTIAQITPSD